MRPPFAVGIVLGIAAWFSLGLDDAYAKRRDPGPVATARKTLQRQGYAKVRVSCARRRRGFTCRWTAVSKRRPASTRCSGSIDVGPARRGRRRARVRRRSCRTATQQPAAGRDATVFGFNEDPTPRNLALQQQTGIGVRRLFVGWNTVELLPGVWTWRSDGAYTAAVANGLRPLLVAIAAPCWANPAAACASVGQAPPDSAHDPDWIEFVRRMTARYPDAIGIEIWNEPNIGPTFAPRPDPARYTQLLKEAYGAVKSVNPRMLVISGGLFASPVSGDYGIADAEFLAGMYEAGAKGSMDAIGYHPYPIAGGYDGSPPRWDSAAMRQSLERLRSARDAVGARSTPIWITEMGVSTASAVGLPPGATEAGQADVLVQMADSVKADPDIPVAIIHRLVDSPEFSVFSLEGGFGVFRSDGSPKRAACALSREFQGSLRC